MRRSSTNTVGVAYLRSTGASLLLRLAELVSVTPLALVRFSQGG
jgi:hypothetical protein